MSRQKERRLLQMAVALACVVPISAGTAGILNGPAMIDGKPGGDMADLESHYRYLSGLLLGLGLAFAASIPTIERRSGLFLVLSSVIVIGGLARLSALFTHGMPGTPHVLALVMELMVVPLLFAWQRRVSRQWRS